MSRRLVVRGLQATMVLYLVLSGVELAARSGAVDEDSLVAATAATMWDIREGDDPLGPADEAEAVAETVKRILDAFDDLGQALS
ncbi:MAG: hypothetical protein AAGA93_25445 [Actinomycetota bacterium]